MKLYFSPGACSLSAHIALREAGLPFDLEQVDLRAKKTKAGVVFSSISPKGAVPTLQLDDGQILTEGPAIVQYIADRKPESQLAPQAGTLERYRLQEWLNYVTSEIHKGFSPLFKATTPAEYKETLKAALAERFDYLARHLEKQKYLLGEKFTVADGYLFTVLNWTKHVAIDLSRWPVLQAYQARVAARPAVHEALKAEGLLKA
ncbi:MAG: glutathione transferase GstA [Myxococcales bacterium]